MKHNTGLSRRSKYLLFSLGISCVSFILYLFIYTPYYETLDDIWMAMLVENATGASNGVVLFENIIYTKGLQLLYSFIPTIKWYTVVQLALIFMSMLVILYLIFKRAKLPLGIGVNLLVAFIIGKEFANTLQFTRTAAILCVAGVLLVFDSFKSNSKKNKIIKIILGTVLLVFSAFIRFNSFAMSAVVLSGIGIYRIIEILKSKDNDKAKQIISYFLIFAIAFAFPLAANAVNNSFYSKGEAHEYIKYNSYRSDLSDYGMPDYEQNKELYESLGISEEDQQFFRRWNYDLDIMTTYNLKKLVEVNNHKSFDNLFSDDTISSLLAYILPNAYLICAGILMIIMILLNRQKLSFGVIEILLVALLQGYLAYIDRFGWSRINISIFVPLIISILFCFDYNKIGKKKLVNIIVVMIAITFGITGFVAPNNKCVDRRQEIHKLYDYITDDKDTMYSSLLEIDLTDSKDPYSFIESISFFEVVPPNKADNIYQMGCWDCYSHTNLAIAQNYGVDNVYNDGVDNQNVVFITKSDENRQRCFDYIKRNYHQDATMNVVKEISDIKLWRAVTRDYDLSNEKIIDNDPSIVSNLTVSVDNGNINISGVAYKKDFNSFKQRSFAVITSKNDNNHCFEIELNDNGELTDVNNGAFSNHNGSWQLNENDEYIVSVVIFADGQYYLA